MSLSGRAQVGELDFLRSMNSGWLGETHILDASGGRSGKFLAGRGTSRGVPEWDNNGRFGVLLVLLPGAG